MAQPLVSEYRYDFKDTEQYVYKEEKGLSEKVVRNISCMKKESAWLQEFRLKALKIFLAKKRQSYGSQTR